MNFSADAHDTIRVVLYSHDSQGMGHVRRNLAIAHELARTLPELSGKKVSGLLISGAVNAQVFGLPEGFDWFFIPSIAKSPKGYIPRNLDADWNTLRAVRSRAISGALRGFNPDLVIVDRHIYGVDHELRIPLQKLRQHNPETKIVLGMREVLDSQLIAQQEWDQLGAPCEVDALIDEVWIYGDSRIHDPVRTGELPSYLAEKARYTGYLSLGRAESEVPGEQPWDKPFILTTAGGGADGHQLLSAAVAMEVPAGHRHIVVTGPHLSQAEFDELNDAASPHTTVYRMWPGLAAVMGEATAVISMGGYNTVAEILATEAPALIVPREYPRLEQLIRALVLQKHAALDVLRPYSLTPEALADWAQANAGKKVNRTRIERAGLQRVGQLAAELLRGEELTAELAQLVGAQS